MPPLATTEALTQALAAAQAREAALRRALLLVVDERVRCADGRAAIYAWMTPEKRAAILDALALAGAEASK